MPKQVYSYNLIKISDQTTNSSTMVQDTDLNFYMQPNTAYNIEALININVSGDLSIYQWSISGPDMPNSVLIKNELLILGNTSVSISSQNSYGITNSTITLAVTSAMLRINAIIENGANSGEFSINFACASGAYVTNGAGSYLRQTFGITID